LRLFDLSFITAQHLTLGAASGYSFPCMQCKTMFSLLFHMYTYIVTHTGPQQEVLWMVGIRPNSQTGASGWSAPTTNMDAPTGNLQNVEDRHADQPTKKHVTPYCIHMLSLLNCCGWKQLIFKHVCICKMFCIVL
jgi:hypothetical protein